MVSIILVCCALMGVLFNFLVWWHQRNRTFTPFQQGKLADLMTQADKLKICLASLGCSASVDPSVEKDVQGETTKLGYATPTPEGFPLIIAGLSVGLGWLLAHYTKASSLAPLEKARLDYLLAKMDAVKTETAKG